MSIWQHNDGIHTSRIACSKAKLFREKCGDVRLNSFAS